MALSAIQMEYLEALYDSWGVEEVRAQLEQDERGVFVDPDVTEFAQAWLALHEHDSRRKSLGKWAFVGAIVAGAAVGLMLVG